jgi:hypothetical protein
MGLKILEIYADGAKVVCPVQFDDLQSAAQFALQLASGNGKLARTVEPLSIALEDDGAILLRLKVFPRRVAAIVEAEQRTSVGLS